MSAAVLRGQGPPPRNTPQTKLGSGQFPEVVFILGNFRARAQGWHPPWASELPSIPPPPELGPAGLHAAFTLHLPPRQESLQASGNPALGTVQAQPGGTKRHFLSPTPSSGDSALPAGYLQALWSAQKHRRQPFPVPGEILMTGSRTPAAALGNF